MNKATVITKNIIVSIVAKIVTLFIGIFIQFKISAVKLLIKPGGISGGNWDDKLEVIDLVKLGKNL